MSEGMIINDVVTILNEYPEDLEVVMADGKPVLDVVFIDGKIVITDEKEES